MEDRVAAAHPVVGRPHQWDSVKFYQTVRVDPGKSNIVARLSDETPLLLEKKIGEGRVLVRYSGTEAKVRVLVEGPDKKQIEGYAGGIAAELKKAIGA